MDFITVFNLNNGIYNWIIPVLGVIVSSIFLFIAISLHQLLPPLDPFEEITRRDKGLYFNYQHPYYRNSIKAIIRFGFVLSLVATIGLSFASISTYFNVKKRFSTGNYSIQEGEVSDIVYITEGDSRVKSFKIDDKIFYVYGQQQLKLFFLNSGAYNDHLLNGQVVKILYSENNLLKVDILNKSSDSN